ncbi:Aste57867_19082 [Aphanomyces stellatus]|uniref:Aste57867_19082 protein n=1 Tax=Aphanomyces stellatus TaxID=120398 RepID=A0A485LBP9_9STRA|nr:hypothetical protein As57867_019018 [Aphanomyces stellatus]VFT95807.1 Aste57867_19082 [Aphanomyces stellatus]
MGTLSALVVNDLHRVFNFLRGYAARAKLKRLESELDAKLEQSQVTKAATNGKVPREWCDFPDDAYEILQVLGEGGETESEDALRRAILLLKHDVAVAKGDGMISSADLGHALRDMGLPLSKMAVDHMIWEVDDDMDAHVSMDECRAMYERCVEDTQGVEPTQLFHVVQFLIYDQDFNFQVSVGEIAQRSLVRHNSELLHRQLSSLFGKDKPDSLVSLATYWGVVNTTMPNLFN